MALNTGCCSAGYTFVDVNGYFINPSTGLTQLVGGYDPKIPYNECFILQVGAYTLASAGIPTVPCPCCPPLYAYVNAEGYASLVAGNVVLVGTYAANKCVSLGNFNTLVNPGLCPCCPPGYVYNSVGDFCVNIDDNLRGVLTIGSKVPCIACHCETIAPPQCPECAGNEGLPIVFTYDPTIRQCNNCGVVGEPTGLGTFADTFIPIQLLDPIINFKRT